MVWHTTVNSTDSVMLKQHCYVNKEFKVPYIGDNYSGNISLCGKVSISEDGETYVPIEQISVEEIKDECCKTCLKIFNNKL